mgnify:CR=1 FL=1
MLTLRQNKHTKLALQLLKWGVLILIGIIAVTTLDFSSVIQNLRAFQFSTVLIFFLLASAATLFYAVRWLLIAGSMGILQLNLLFVLRLNLLSEFVSIVLPSYLGGDGLRLLRLRPYTTNRNAAMCVLIDRLVGLFTLGIATLICLPSILPLLNISIDSQVIPYIVIIAGVLAVAGLLLIRQIPRLLLAFGLGDLHFDVKPLLIAALLSLVGHMIYASAYAVLFLSLTDATPVQVMAITLLALLTRSIPVSFLGVEVSDGSLVVLGQLLNIDPTLSLAVVAVVLSSRYVFALIGFAWELMTDGLGFLANVSRKSAA